MIKINVNAEIRKHINDCHKQYVEQTSIPKLEEIIKRRDISSSLFINLFGATKDMRKENLVNYCINPNLDILIRQFEDVFESVYGFKHNSDSNDEAKSKITSVYRDINSIMYYDGFNVGKVIDKVNKTRWNRHEFVVNLGVKVCPYCNRIYISSYEDKSGGKTTADVDHYFPKGEYPILQMNIYNMIPSCSICNSRMKGKHFKKHLYPYTDQSDSMKFEIPIEIGNEVSKILIDTKHNEKAATSVEVFKLENVYQTHLDEAMAVKQSMISYSEFKENAYKAEYGLDVSGKIYDMYFGFMKDDVSTRPLTKLKQDIFVQLNNILDN